MDLSHRQDLVQQQTLHLTTELRQGLHVLQLNAADLAEYLNDRIEENPVFIDARYESSLPPRMDVRPDEMAFDAPEGEASSSTADANRTLYSGLDRHATRVSADALLESRGHGAPERFDGERRDMSQRSFSFDRYLAVPETLTEHLMSQIRLLTADEELRSVCGFLAGNLDSNGYLAITVEEGSEILGVDCDSIERALALLQSLSPVGIAARNLAECLRLQLEHEGLMTPVLDDLLTNHLNDLERKSAASVARDMGLAPEQLEEALADIRLCNPRPGLQFGSGAESVWPEIVVERDIDGSYVVKTQDVLLPDLRIDEGYRVIADEVADKSTARYLKEKLREAEGLIEGVAFRKETLYKVACCITELQSEFFDEGLSRLRPLTMTQVADAVGVSVSTVSRVVNGNYMQTPRGTFELRFFFHGATAAEGAVEVSALSVKERIRQIVDAENPYKPLSDQAIADALGDEGVEISRRTVAKYRDQLGIPVRAVRKRA